MDHIVVVAVTLDDHEERFFMTWGRIQDKVAPEPLEQLVWRHSTNYDLGGKPIKARLCRTLQEAANAPFFYEGFFSFCQAPIPFGNQYEAWRNALNEKMQRGEKLYYLRNPTRFLGNDIITPANTNVPVSPLSSTLD